MIGGTQVLGSEEFMEYVREVLEIPQALELNTNLFEDLGFDSLMTYELLVAVEDLGVEVEEEQWLNAQTIGDCFDLYRLARAHAASIDPG
jgi:acyl carrier protein